MAESDTDHSPRPVPDDVAVRRVLLEIQRRGGIGRVPIDEAIAHADRYAAAVPPLSRTAIDLGSGGGLPGLVIAARCPDLTVELVERRAKRADLLRYGVRSLGLGDRVRVTDADVAVVIARVTEAGDRVDLVSARSFAPLPVVLDCARSLLRAGGTCLVSAPPDVEGPPSLDPVWRADRPQPGLWSFVLDD